MKRLIPILLCGVASAVVAACGSSAPAPASSAPVSGKRVDPASTGTVTGRIVFQGDRPAVELVRMNTDQACVTNAGPNPQSDAVLIADDGGVRNTFVWVKDGLDPGYVFDTPTAPAVIDQKGCIYKPRVLGVQVGQPIEVVNSDPTLHNVHALPMVNQEFNQGQPVQFMKLSRTFTAPEVMVRFKCDVHNWMAAWVGVVAHPYFAVSDESGVFQIPNLPPGTYTLEAWHEKFNPQTMKVTIASGQAQTASFTFSSADAK
jgi:plastocyanin